MSHQLTMPPDVKTVLRQWYAENLLDSTRVLEGSVFGWVFGLTGQHAVTVNKTVHLTKNADPEGTPGRTVLLGHELFHVAQQMDMGWWPFLLRYLWRWRPTHIKHGVRHPYEVPAYARGREIRAALEGR